MGRINIKKAEAREFQWKFNMMFAGNDTFFNDILLRWNKIFWLVPQHLLRVFSAAYSRRRSCSLVAVWYATLLIGLCFTDHNCNRFCSSAISGLIPENHEFQRNTRVSQLAHPCGRLARNGPQNIYRRNSFFSWTNRVCNCLPAEVLIF